MVVRMMVQTVVQQQQMVVRMIEQTPTKMGLQQQQQMVVQTDQQQQKQMVVQTDQQQQKQMVAQMTRQTVVQVVLFWPSLTVETLAAMIKRRMEMGGLLISTMAGSGSSIVYSSPAKPL